MILAEESPRGCGLMNPRYMVIGTMSCGFTNVGVFGNSDYPYIEITSGSISGSNPGSFKGIYAHKLLGFERNWYVLKIQWSRNVRQDEYLLEKVEATIDEN